MGYVRDKIYVLEFAEDEYEGLVIRARSAPVGKFLDLAAIADAAQGAPSADSFLLLVQGFADSLVSWNLELEDGTPIPATFESLKEQDFDFVLAVIMAWMDAISSVAGPLVQNSNNGQPSALALIPMEVIEQSQAS